MWVKFFCFVFKLLLISLSLLMHRSHWYFKSTYNNLVHLTRDLNVDYSIFNFYIIKPPTTNDLISILSAWSYQYFYSPHLDNPLPLSSIQSSPDTALGQAHIGFPTHDNNFINRLCLYCWARSRTVRSKVIMSLNRIHLYSLSWIHSSNFLLGRPSADCSP